MSIVVRLIVVAATLCCIPLDGFALKGDMDSALSHMHRAESAFARKQLDEATREYGAILRVIRTLDLEVREWFQGNADFGLALCSALRHDTAGTRSWIDEAMVHRYWVFSGLQMNQPITEVLGRRYVDSLVQFWEEIRQDKSRRWTPVATIIIRPDRCDPTRRLPTIIALHGGNDNLTEFSDLWQAVADSLCVNVVIPPGVARLSRVGFAWDFAMQPIDSLFRGLIQRPEYRAVTDTEHVYLMGFSQGGNAAIGLALRHAESLAGVVVIEGFTVEHLDTSLLIPLRNHGVGFYGIYGDLGYVPFQENFVHLQQLCETAGVRTHLEVVPGMVHEVPANLVARMGQALRWLGAGTPSQSIPNTHDVGR